MAQPESWRAGRGIAPGSIDRPYTAAIAWPAFVACRQRWGEREIRWIGSGSRPSGSELAWWVWAEDPQRLAGQVTRSASPLAEG